MNIWKENEDKEIKMTGIFIDLQTAKKLAKYERIKKKIIEKKKEKENVDKK